MLLRVRAIADQRGLRENVRIAEIRFSLVGGQLRETQNQGSSRNSRCRSTFCAPAKGRTRFELSELCGLRDPQ
jgi:hypothetical protein